MIARSFCKPVPQNSEVTCELPGGHPAEARWDSRCDSDPGHASGISREKAGPETPSALE